MIDIGVKGGTVGSQLHGNPMYSGRGLVTFTISTLSTSSSTSCGPGRPPSPR